MLFKQFVSSLMILGAFITSSYATTNTNKINSDFIPINSKAISYSIKELQNETYRKGTIRNLYLPSYSHLSAKGKYERLDYEDLTDKSFVVHRRTDNGVAGSGIKYKVDYTVKELSNPLEYRVVLKPSSYYKYQQGWIGKFPIPNYTLEDLTKTLMSGQVYYYDTFIKPTRLPTTLASGVLDSNNLENYNYVDNVISEKYSEAIKVNDYTKALRIKKQVKAIRKEDPRYGSVYKIKENILDE